ncbi:MAG: hypothetical protein HY064_10590 [Bacteroidetes bacterium]|nr:hypothetical protein [Bacteroidota bacterium]
MTVIFIGTGISAQTTTRGDGNNSSTTGSKKTKILLIPWEPKMFNCSSDITRAIANETGQKYDQVQDALRKGFVESVKHSFGATCNVVSLLDDTAMKRDLEYVYNVTSMSYTPVDFPLNPTKADSAKLKAASGVQKGQVETADDDADKFMNTVIISPNLLTYLRKVYKVDYVIFINEMDIDNDLGADPYNLQGKEDFKRVATAHWTIFNSTTGKRVAMGKSKSNFSSTSNTPKKIIDSAFATITKAVYEKYLVGIKPTQ